MCITRRSKGSILAMKECIYTGMMRRKERKKGRNSSRKRITSRNLRLHEKRSKEEAFFSYDSLLHHTHDIIKTRRTHSIGHFVNDFQEKKEGESQELRCLSVWSSLVRRRTRRLFFLILVSSCAFKTWETRDPFS